MRPAAIGWLLGPLLMLAACHKLLGDYTLDPSVDAGCASGAVQCVGNVLQGCNSLGTGWDNRAVCASETLCDKAHGMCLPPLCAGGERHCQDAELRVCSATRDGWDHLQTCASAGRCSAESGSCTDQPCTPGALQCNGNVLESCKDDQSGWNDQDTCGSAALCNKAQGKCDDATCRPGESHCEGAELQRCNDMKNGWSPVQSCDSEALCDASNGSCGAVACTLPGAFRCTDSGALERCADDLTNWVAVTTCQSAAYCDAVNGACTDAPCQAGAHQCNGATLAVCSADRSRWDAVDTCQTDALCQQTLSAGAATCLPPVCAVGDTKCVDGQPQICNAGRSDFRANGAACATAELCNDGTGTCAEPVCAPSDTRCSGAQPEICNPGRTGYVANGSACASDALCNPSTGTCGAQKCVAKQLRCDPANPTHLQSCKADLTDWEALPCDTCATPELCSASLAATTCDQTACKEPSCALSDRWCGGDGNKTLFQCPSSRINSQANALATCATNGLCELTHQKGETTCELPSCGVADLWCAGTGNKTLYQCPTSRINSQATALGTCVTNGLCELSHSEGKTSCEAPKCAVGGTKCSGTGNKTLQMCNGDQTGFADCATCSTAALCTDSLGAQACNASACLACAVGEAHCNAAGNYETCAANRMGFNVTDCQGNGCDETLGGCLAAAAGGAGP